MAKGFGEIFKFIYDLAGLNDCCDSERSFHKTYPPLIRINEKSSWLSDNFSFPIACMSYIGSNIRS